MGHPPPSPHPPWLCSSLVLCYMKRVNYLALLPSVTPGTYHKLMHLLSCIKHETMTNTIVAFGILHHSSSSNNCILVTIVFTTTDYRWQSSPSSSLLAYPLEESTLADQEQYIMQVWGRDRVWYCDTKQPTEDQPFLGAFLYTHHIGWQPPVLLRYQNNDLHLIHDMIWSTRQQIKRWLMQPYR